MTQPTHTHATNGGKFALVATHQGTGALDGQRLAIYRDLDRDIESAMLETEWLANWREIKPDDCSICMGAGHDQFKGNKDKPCGHCYGLGKVRKDGQTPADLWELSDVAYRIIQLLQNELEDLRRVAQNPAVQALLEREQKQLIDESTARQEQEWRDGKGHGPGGQRHTGD